MSDSPAREADTDKATSALRESAAAYEAIVEAYDGFIYICSANYTVEFMNKRLVERTGHNAAGQKCYKVLHDLEDVCPWCVNEKVFRGETVRWEVLSPRDNRWYYVTNTPLRHADGSISKLAMIQDITERKKAEASLRSRFEIEQLVSRISTSFITLAPGEIDNGINWALKMIGEFSKVDRSYVFQFSGDGEKMSNTHEWCAEGIEPQIDKLQGIPFGSFPWWMERLNRGEHIHIPRVAALPPEAGAEKASLEAQAIKSLIAVPMVSGPALIGFLGFDSVNSEKAWIEEDILLLKTVADILVNALKHIKSEEFIRNVLNNVDESFIVIDPEFRIVSANKAFCDQVKLPAREVVGKHCYEVSHPLVRPCFEEDMECAVKQTFETGEPCNATHIHYDSAGDPIYVETKSYPLRDVSGKLVSVIEVIHDITEKKKLEDQLHHAQKMEAIGTLAGGVAHDFNNILTAILGYGHLLQMKMKEDDPLKVFVDHILSSSERAAHLTQGLLAFSRKEMNNPRILKLNDVVRSIEKLLERLIGEDIELITVLTGTRDDLSIMADNGQIEQVLMNLATNARDAMPEGGRLLIKTEHVALDKDFHQVHGFGKPGAYAGISVSDTGSGMDENTKRRIFEPFFTTKDVGKGTGLGLSIVYGIVKQHGGYITVYSETGEGTTFKIYLPAINAELETERLPARKPVKGGTETILVAEDSDEVRLLAKNVLERFGYRVVEAENGEDAVGKYIENREAIRLLLLDVVMPKKNGRAAYAEIKKIDPGIKVLFTSGYAEELVRDKGILEEGLNFIAKPLSPNDLLAKVREVLDS